MLRNEQFTLNCDVNDNPAYTALSWLEGSDIMPGQDTDTYIVANGVKSDSEFSCRVRNAVGTGTGLTRVTVHCKLL